MTSLNMLLVGILAACGSVSLYARPSYLALSDELTLNSKPRYFVAYPLAPTHTPVNTPPEETLYGAAIPVESMASFEAMNYEELKEDVKAFAEGSAEEGGIRVHPYHIRSTSELTGEERQVTSLDIASMPTRIIGFTIGWKF